MSATSPYVSLSSHCRLLYYIDSEHNPFAVISSETVQHRGAARLRFHTPSLEDNNNNNNNSCCSNTEHTKHKTIGKESECYVEEEEEEHEQQKSFKRHPHVYVTQLTSDDLFPKLTASSKIYHNNNITDDNTNQNAMPVFLSTLELAQECYKRDVQCDARQVKRYKSEYEEQIESSEKENNKDNENDMEMQQSVKHASNVSKTLNVMRFVRHELLLRTLFQVLLILQQPHRSPRVHFTVERLTHSTLTFLVSMTSHAQIKKKNVIVVGASNSNNKNNSVSSNIQVGSVEDKLFSERTVDNAQLRICLWNCLGSVDNQIKRCYCNNVDGDIYKHDKSIYTNMECSFNVLCREQKEQHGNFLIVAVNRSVFHYIITLNENNNNNNNVSLLDSSLQSQLLHERSFTDLMNENDKNNIISIVFNYNVSRESEQSELEYELQKSEEQQEEEQIKITSTSLEPFISHRQTEITTTEATMQNRSEVSMEKLITHLQRRGFVFCALSAHCCWVNYIKQRILTCCTHKQFSGIISSEVVKKTVHLYQFMPLQMLQVNHFTTWESMLCVCNHNVGRESEQDKVKVKENVNSQTTFDIINNSNNNEEGVMNIETLCDLESKMLLSVHVSGCEQVMRWRYHHIVKSRKSYDTTFSGSLEQLLNSLQATEVANM